MAKNSFNEPIHIGEIGLVTALEGSKAVVTMERKEACAKCRACSAGIEGKEMIIRALNLCEAKEGDYVEVMLDNSNFLKAAAIMYGIPFLAFMLGIFIGYYGALALFGSYAEICGTVLGILFVALSYGWIKSKESTWKKGNYIPKAVAIANKKEI